LSRVGGAGLGAQLTQALRPISFSEFGASRLVERLDGQVSVSFQDALNQNRLLTFIPQQPKGEGKRKN
jgi:hypothetical protein